MARTNENTVGTPREQALTREAYPASWLAAKLGIEPLVLEARRRAGELLGVPTAGGQYLYPTWQFGRNGEPLASIPRVVQTGRAAGLSDRDLCDLLLRRDGMTGRDRLVEALRAGRDDRILDAIRSLPRRESTPSPS
jgi:hypothetical protein